MSWREQIQPERIPQHIAIIMDGNGRWAQQQGLQRACGHQQGVQSVHHITEACAQLGVRYLTLYAFSIENWNRPQAEVDMLMALIIDVIEKETPTLLKNNVRLLAIGNLSRLPLSSRQKLEQCMQQTASNTGLNLVLALSYSARWEITEAVRQLASQVQQGELSSTDINEGLLASHMTTAFMPDPDLLIRTSGELRISNFLLWQLAYTELYFTDVLWPAFTQEDLFHAIVDYQHRERRFGKTSEQLLTK